MIRAKFGLKLSTATAALAVAALVSGVPAYSQETPPADAELGLEEIIVTADRREQNLLDVPAAVSAVTGDTLDVLGIRDFRSLELTTPNLQITDNSGFGRPFLRGIGSAIFNTGAESSIAVYVDDVPRPRLTGLSTDLATVERVEVLRGPQGALYGRNATGGAINIVTRTPGRDNELDARVAYGNYNTIEAEAYVAGPISDGLSLGLSASHRGHDGYSKNLADGPDLESANSENVGGKLVARPSDALTLTLAGDYTWMDDTRGIGFRQLRPGSSTEVAGLVTSGNLPALAQAGTTASTFYLTLLAGGCAQAFATPGCTPVQLGQFFGLAGSQLLPLLPDFGATTRPHRVSIDAASDPSRRVRDYGGSLNLNWSLGNVDLTSITAYREHDWRSQTDFDATAVTFLGFYARIDSQTLSQELRLASSGDGAFSWSIGANYFDDEVGNVLGGKIFGMAPPALLTLSDLETRAIAGFAQGRYAFTDQLALTVSGRYSHERKRIVYPTQASTGGVEIRGKTSFDDFSPSLTLEYKLTDDALTYLRYAKGFKSGGINSFVVPTFLAGVNSFEPETIHSVEAGYRASLFDNRVRFTTAAFHYWYNDLQVERLGGPAGGASITLNADKARVYGVEADVVAKATSNLTLSAAVGLLNAKYTDFNIDAATAARLVIAPVDNSDNRLPFAPRFSANVGADIREPLNDKAALSASAGLSYKGRTFFEAENRPLTSQSAYAVVNGRVGVAGTDDRWGVYLFANNLFDKDYLALAQTSLAGTFATDSPPRTYGISLEAKW